MGVLFLIGVNVWRAYFSAFAGSFVMMTLSDPIIKGYKAIGICGFGIALWLFSIVEACIAVLNVSRETFYSQLLTQPEVKQEPAIERYMFQVDLARYIYADVPTDDMEKLAVGLLQGRPFSEREWSGEVKNFRSIQDEFERRDLVRMEGKRRILNGRGRRAMLEIAYGHAVKSSPPPTALKPLRQE